MADWTPDLATSDKPRYLAIADAIADDIGAGRLMSATACRRSANWQNASTSISPRSRAAMSRRKERGLIESKVGQGTFVREKPKPRRSQPPPRPVDLSMNLPPEPDDPELIERMQAGVE